MKRFLVVLSLVIFTALVLGCRCEQEPVGQVDLDDGLVEVQWTLGTDAEERWVGFEDFKAAMEQQFAATESLQVSLHDEAFKLHRSGEVAWYSCVADFKGTSMGEEFEIAGLRVTAVLEKLLQIR